MLAYLECLSMFNRDASPIGLSCGHVSHKPICKFCHHLSAHKVQVSKKTYSASLTCGSISIF